MRVSTARRAKSSAVKSSNHMIPSGTIRRLRWSMQASTLRVLIAVDVRKGDIRQIPRQRVGKYAFVKMRAGHRPSQREAINAGEIACRMTVALISERHSAKGVEQVQIAMLTLGERIQTGGTSAAINAHLDEAARRSRLRRGKHRVEDGNGDE